MAKNWVITVEPTDKSSPKRPVEMINGRKKIGEVEKRLCELFIELSKTQPTDLADSINRMSGLTTILTKAPYVFEATLTDS